MKKLNLLTAVAIVLSAAAMLYLAKTMAAQQSTDACHPGSTPNSCKVIISPNANGTVTTDPESLTIHQDQNQTVEWDCSTNCTFDVDFSHPEGSPFSANQFHGSPQNPHAKSGLAHKKGTFNYTVSVDGAAHDPQIIVR